MALLNGTQFSTAYALAGDRDNAQIVRIIEEAEAKQRGARSGIAGPPAGDTWVDAIRSGDVDRVTGMFDADPALVHAFHAPFQVVTNESLSGWRDIFKQILAQGPLPKGIRRIEVTGGIGPMLIFEPPNWTGLIVK